MVPNALYGTATVIVLYDAVRRALGREIALLAALMMALTPVAVLVGRYNTPDALLLMLLVCAAWSLTVAAQSGRLRDLLLCAAAWAWPSTRRCSRHIWCCRRSRSHTSWRGLGRCVEGWANWQRRRA